MNESRTKQSFHPRKTSLLLTTLILTGLASSCYAQTSPPPATHDTSFLSSPPKDAPQTFSGLASPAPALTPPPAQLPTDIIAPPVATTPIADVSPESIGAQNAESLGTDMWKGTPYATAENLLSLAAPTSSPILNNLTRRLLVTAATTPEGEAIKGEPSLTTLRIEKLLNFGAGQEAWTLAKQADPTLIDDITFHTIAEHTLATDGQDLCGEMPEWIKKRTSVDWQEAQIICQLRAKDTKTAQVALDVLRAQENHDNVFLGIADKNILGDSKTLPRQLSSLTPATLALLRLANLPLPASLYLHPDTTLIPALLQAPAQLDVAQLTLAERAAERGIIDSATLEAIYRNVAFPPDALAAPLTANATNLRLHALLFRAAMDEKDQQKRIAYTVKFVQSVTPALLNGASTIASDMLGEQKPDATNADNAVTLTRIYMTAGKEAAALDWLKLARLNTANAPELLKLWPQLALAGLEAETDYTANFAKWFDATVTTADPKADMHAATAALLLLDAANLPVPDTAWSKLLTARHNDKHIALSPILLERLQSAGVAKKRAETVLLATALANDSELSLPTAVAITRALRLAGFKNEASAFAREEIALLAQGN